MGRQLAILTTLTAATLCAGGALAQRVDPYEATIRAAGIEPTKEALSEYLLSLIPNDENRQREEELVEQLGDASFRLREEAEAALTGMPNPPLDLLDAAAQSDDPETRYRARHILEQTSQGGARRAPNAVFGYIAHHELKGLAHPVLQYFPYSGETSAYGLASKAVLATVTEDDLDLLRRATKRKPPARRAIAVLALAKLLGEQAQGELLPMLKHEDAVVRLAAAEALADLGRREALAPLVILLDSDELELRARGAGVLRSVTHQRFDFVAYDHLDAREPAAKRWRTWLAENEETAELHFPLAPMHRFFGRTLMSLYPKTLREIDAEGNTLMEAGGFQYVWGCHATDDGVRVVADFSQKVLLEFDPSGEETLRLAGLPGKLSDVRRLENGNFLLALADADKVAEINREGKVVWSVDAPGRPTTVNRLENGNTLVNLQFGKKVVEVDREGKIVWELGGMHNALTAQALANGNVLVCEMNQGRAVEYNRDGRVVWEKRGFQNACQAQRLPGGNTLISDNNGLHEYDTAGEEVWSLDVPRGRFWRY